MGAVREFKAPQAPTPPTLPDLATELGAYEASEPTLAPKTADREVKEGEAQKEEGKLSGPALLAFLEQDLPKDDLHHH